MEYKDNVGALCARLDVPNPVQEDDLIIEKIIFYHQTERSKDDWKLEVPGTDMNCAGRLFVQSKARHAPVLQLEPIRAESAEFFTRALWDDCSNTHRTLVFGMKEATVAELFYKKK